MSESAPPTTNIARHVSAGMRTAASAAAMSGERFPSSEMREDHLPRTGAGMSSVKVP